MNFTYRSYRQLLEELREGEYRFSNYHDYSTINGKVVILRHDVDMSLDSAVKLAEIEYEAGVASTFFVLLRTDFYNVASKKSQICIERIKALGHEIGLHFDETFILGTKEVVPEIVKEKGILSNLCNCDITTVSMHRPSVQTLNADYKIPGMVNSYSKTFFNEFKYLSDSRRMWREPVLDIVKNQKYEKLHILTHAFWYKECEESISETVKEFVTNANKERYYQVANNVRNIEEIFQAEEVVCR